MYRPLWNQLSSKSQSSSKMAMTQSHRQLTAPAKIIKPLAPRTLIRLQKIPTKEIQGTTQQDREEGVEAVSVELRPAPHQ